MLTKEQIIRSASEFGIDLLAHGDHRGDLERRQDEWWFTCPCGYEARLIGRKLIRGRNDGS